MIIENDVRELLSKLEPVIGYQTTKGLWIRYLMARTQERREKLRRRIRILAESLLNLYDLSACRQDGGGIQ